MMALNPDSVVIKALEYAQKYGSVVGVCLGRKAMVFLTDPQDIEVILGSSAHLDKSEEYE